MYKLLFAFSVASLLLSCSSIQSKPAEDEEGPVVKEKHKIVKDDDDKKPESGWSQEDKDRLKAEWKKTFANMKKEVEEEDEFDEADFINETKNVVSCSLQLFEKKFTDYDAYKKASNKDHFTSDPQLLNQLAGCTHNLMEKYSRSSQ